LTVLVNGGEIALLDVAESLRAGRRVLPVPGTWRAADGVAAALVGSEADERGRELVGTGLVEAVSLADDSALEERVNATLTRKSKR